MRDERGDERGERLDHSHMQLQGSRELNCGAWLGTREDINDALLAIGGNDHAIQIISLAYGRVIGLLRGHTGPIIDLQAFSSMPSREEEEEGEDIAQCVHPFLLPSRRHPVLPHPLKHILLATCQCVCGRHSVLCRNEREEPRSPPPMLQKIMYGSCNITSWVGEKRYPSC